MRRSIDEHGDTRNLIVPIHAARVKIFAARTCRAKRREGIFADVRDGPIFSRREVLVLTLLRWDDPASSRVTMKVGLYLYRDTRLYA